MQFFVERDAALLADEMGLGKTVQTAVAMELLISTKRCSKVLIICPSSLTLNWVKELKKWAPSATLRRITGNVEDRKAHYWLPFKVWIASYEQIRMDIDFIYKHCSYDLVILDEAQRIKNIDSNLSVAARQIKRKKSWTLTGTPVENNVDDLYAIFAFLSPKLVLQGKQLSKVHEMIRPFFLRRTKKEVLNDLPPIIEHDLNLELLPEQRKSYDASMNDAFAEYASYEGKMPTTQLFAKLTKLKQICNFDPITGHSCKLDALQLLLDKLQVNNEKALVFSQYVKSLNELGKHMFIPFDLFHGGLNATQRAELVDRFEESSESRVLLISLKAGGVGLNLNTASVVILYDMWWNPAVEKQAIQRAHRFGKKEPLYVIRFVVEDTIEERTREILLRKNDMFEAVVEQADVANVHPFKREELLSILGFNR